MSLSDQALNLLDIHPSISKRRRLDNFSCLDSEIALSISNGTITIEEVAPPLAASLAPPFSMAARLDRPQYEEQAKAEALMNALRQMRSKHGAKPSNWYARRIPDTVA